MKNYNSIIVDDEKPARDLIESYIEKILELKLIAVCKNVMEAQPILNNRNIDILFLDIQMPELTGVEFLRLLNNMPATIFITAHSTYALEGYELDVVDYLLKPVEFGRFYKAVSKAINWLERTDDSKNRQSGHLATSADAEDNTSIFVKADKEIVKLNVNEILFIKSEREYVQIYARRKLVLTLQSLSKFTQVLPKKQFFRVHRSFIVNLQAIESIMGNTIYIKEHRIPISRGQRQEFLEMINKNQLF
ncbi:MAG: LytR/AlgR family response regulator transcription factor [Calditrichia bacterium]